MDMDYTDITLYNLYDRIRPTKNLRPSKKKKC